jgi:hypothetical protein
LFVCSLFGVISGVKIYLNNELNSSEVCSSRFGERAFVTKRECVCDEA